MEVFALVGPAGTGKSHRASLLAHRYQIDLIVDDGLLIRESEILAGRSAKREETRMAAVRRAIFADPEHAAEVKERIRELKPGRVLVLGTSANMVNLIVDALDLPRPDHYIHIQDIASEREIEKAKRIRQEQGRHVIPAPTFEVKKGFSGYLIDPLRFFMRGKTGAEQLIEKSVVRPTFSSLGRFFIADTVVASIAARACRGVEGVTRVGRVRVESKSEGVVIQMELTLKYGTRLPEVLIAAQERVKELVEYMTALNVLAVNLVAKRLSLD